MDGVFRFEIVVEGVERLFRAFGAYLCGQSLLFRLIDRDLFQALLFVVEHIVDRAQHQHYAGQRHADDGVHPRNERVRLFTRHIAAHREFAKIVFVAGGQHGRTDDDLCLAVRDDAVVVKVGGDVVAYVRVLGEDVVSERQHRVARQIDKRVKKELFAAAKHTDRDPGEVADQGAKIVEIDLAHTSSY